MPGVLAGELHGLGAYVDAPGVEVRDGAAEEGVQEEGYAARARAEVQHAEGCWRGRRVPTAAAEKVSGLDEAGQVCGVGLWLWPLHMSSSSLVSQCLLFVFSPCFSPFLSLE